MFRWVSRRKHEELVADYVAVHNVAVRQRITLILLQDEMTQKFPDPETIDRLLQEHERATTREKNRYPKLQHLLP